MCQGGRADQAPGMCVKDPGGIQPLCHLGFFVIVLCVVVLPLSPPRFIFSSCHPIIFFPPSQLLATLSPIWMGLS